MPTDCILTALSITREMKVATTDTPFDWKLLPNTQNVVIPTPGASEAEMQPTNTGGITQSRPTWVKFTPLTFDLPVDQTDATTNIVLNATRLRQKLWFNVSKSDYAGSDAVQFEGYVMEAGDGGTEGVYTRSVSVQPCGDVDEEATIAVVVP